jgi:hypothetical protein
MEFEVEGEVVGVRRDGVVVVLKAPLQRRCKFRGLLVVKEVECATEWDEEERFMKTLAERLWRIRKSPCRNRHVRDGHVVYSLVGFGVSAKVARRVIKLYRMPAEVRRVGTNLYVFIPCDKVEEAFRIAARYPHGGVVTLRNI